MLDYAYFYQGELQDCIRKIINDKKIYFYFMCPSKFFSIPIERDDWDTIQCVSVLPNREIVGFMAAYADHRNNLIYNLDFINFTGKINPVFSRDAIAFLDDLFVRRKFRKIMFNAIIGNPAVEMYRKFIKKMNGKEVGIMKENRLLTDGKYYDEIIFELYRENYLKRKK